MILMVYRRLWVKYRARGAWSILLPLSRSGDKMVYVGPKRKRDYSGESQSMKRARALVIASGRKINYHGPRWRPGFDRTTGRYGRFRAGMHSELKWHDIVVSDVTVVLGGTIQNGGTVNIIAQGVGASQRVGRRIHVKSIHWHYGVKQREADGVASPSEANACRIILYVDKQCNGTTAAVTDILRTDDAYSFRNLDNVMRFDILLDKTVQALTLGGGGDGITSDWVGGRMNGTFNKTCNIPIEYSANTGALTEIRSNNIGVLLVGFTNDALMQFTSTMRLRYTD